MVLVRTETGQLVMVPQQVLAQAQAKTQQGQTVANITQRPATPTAAATIRVSTASTVRLLHSRSVVLIQIKQIISPSLKVKRLQDAAKNQC